MNLSNELKDLSIILDEENLNFTDEDTATLDKVTDAANEISKSFSNSWLGYHATVYYQNFEEPPVGAVFSSMYGLYNSFLHSTKGHWKEYQESFVLDSINNKSGNIELSIFYKKASQAETVFNDIKAEALSIFSMVTCDDFLQKLKEDIEELKVFHKIDFIKYWRPSGKFMSRDEIAINQGIITPPHFKVLAEVQEIYSPFARIKKLSTILKRASNHMKRIENSSYSQNKTNRIFIGHGRSIVWRDLKDFIKDKLNLEYDEFNRVPIAGVTNIGRLNQMLDNATFAFLVMTAEDEQADGNIHARLNVIHEVGLFQGKLGFEKAIILLEEGCEEFTNIQGLGQIRFPKDNISAKFEEIRDVLKREQIL